jgi:hypothetical protein
MEAIRAKSNIYLHNQLKNKLITASFLLTKEEKKNWETN